MPRWHGHHVAAFGRLTIRSTKAAIRANVAEARAGCAKVSRLIVDMVWTREEKRLNVV